MMALASGVPTWRQLEGLGGAEGGLAGVRAMKLDGCWFFMR